MRKIIILLGLFLMFADLNAQQQIANIIYTKKDSTEVMQLIEKAKKLPPTENTFLAIAKQFIGKPYVAHTLDKNSNEKLVINTSQVDCTTFVEYVLAIHLCTKNHKYTFQDFCHYLANVRYVNGEIDYTTRQHYFSLWISDNTADQYVEEISSNRSPFTAIQTVNVNYMTTHANQYQMLRKHPQWKMQIKALEQSINGKKYRYIPKHQTNLITLRKTIHDGDILAIVSSKRGLDIAHLGIAIWENNQLHLLNASSIHKKVVIEPMTLYQYLQKHPTHKGIRVVRVK